MELLLIYIRAVTLPEFPFPPGTPLFPHHSKVEQYHRAIVARWNLSSYIMLHHEVVRAAWVGSQHAGHWALHVLDVAKDVQHESYFDHLIVANGHFHFPAEPHLAGRTAWEHARAGRVIVHSMYYRDPEVYRHRNVVVVGGGASGHDLAQQIVGIANSVSESLYLYLLMQKS